MGWLHDIYKKAIGNLVGLSRDKKSIKIIFYSIGAFSLISPIVFMFSMEYTGTNYPGTLMGSENFSFSYAGNPTYVYVDSDWQDIGMNAINETTANVTVYGTSDIELFPVDRITSTSSARPLKQENGRYILQTVPGDIVSVYIAVKQEDPFDYNMHLTYNKNKNSEEAVVNDTGKDTIFKIYKRGNDQYKIASYFNNSAPKIFSVKNYTRYNFPVTICIKNRPTENADCGLSDVEKINYTGLVTISTNDRMAMQIPVSEISSMAKKPLKSVTIQNSGGNLDVRHVKYECSHADDINIASVYNSTTFKLMNGMVIVSGHARSLDFRERHFQVPWSVILKEGNFAVIIGLLSSFFTIFVGRMFAQIKK